MDAAQPSWLDVALIMFYRFLTEAFPTLPGLVQRTPPLPPSFSLCCPDSKRTCLQRGKLVCDWHRLFSVFVLEPKKIHTSVHRHSETKTNLKIKVIRKLCRQQRESLSGLYLDSR